MNDFPFKPHYLSLGEEQMHYIDEGAGETVLMLHGNPTWSYYYRYLITAFKASNRMIAPDHIGMGLSSKPQHYSYTLSQHIENISSLIKFLDLKNMTLVVHDWGGAVGFGVIKKHPSLFKRIIVLNTAAFLSKNIPRRIAICRHKIWGEWLVRKWNLFAWPATFMASTKSLSSQIKKNYLKPYNNYENRIAIARFVQDIPLEKDHVSYQELKGIDESLSHINLPMLIAWGGRDFCFDQTFFNEWTKRFPKAHAYWFKHAGHYVLEDVPELIIPLMDKFLHSSL
jgi:haloalkane dehalogenase